MVLEGCLLVRGYLTLSSCSLEEGSGSLVVLLSVSVEIKGRDQCPFPAQSSVFLLLLAERDVILGLPWLARVCVCVCAITSPIRQACETPQRNTYLRMYSNSSRYTYLGSYLPGLLEVPNVRT